MKSVYYQIVIWVGVPYSSFNITKDLSQFEGIMSEIGKYPFVKILIDVANIHSWVINSLNKAMYFSYTVLK